MTRLRRKLLPDFHEQFLQRVWNSVQYQQTVLPTARLPEDHCSHTDYATLLRPLKETAG